MKIQYNDFIQFLLKQRILSIFLFILLIFCLFNILFFLNYSHLSYKIVILHKTLVIIFLMPTAIIFSILYFFIKIPVVFIYTGLIFQWIIVYYFCYKKKNKYIILSIKILIISILILATLTTTFILNNTYEPVDHNNKYEIS